VEFWDYQTRNQGAGEFLIFLNSSSITIDNIFLFVRIIGNLELGIWKEKQRGYNIRLKRRCSNDQNEECI
jgi:hypothetical protein